MLNSVNCRPQRQTDGRNGTDARTLFLELKITFCSNLLVDIQNSREKILLYESFIIIVDVLLTNFDIAVAGLTDGSSVANEETGKGRR